ncbi:MAG: enoyl-CoA hydratase/isomerase family protein [Hyphomicrobiaceae bacterium]
MSSDDVIIRREGRAGRLTMNRPQALNALTTPMVAMITKALAEWRDDAAVELVVLDAVGDRALCAGGDVMSLYESRTQGSAFAREFWSAEYRLNAMIGRYPKPFVAIMDGIVMGGGIGLSAHASHRIVTERSMLAMPETGIGLVPDVGGTWLLARAPGEVGTYLGLTGARMSGADAIFARFADTFILSKQRDELLAALREADRTNLDQIIATLASATPLSELKALVPDLDRDFAGESVESILAALERNGNPWAAKTLSGLKSKSPRALKATLATIRQARTLPSLEAALDVEYRLCCRLFEDGEFPEGVRALLVDKDRAPKWNPATLAEVSDADVARLLSPLPAGQELGLYASG